MPFESVCSGNAKSLKSHHLHVIRAPCDLANLVLSSRALSRGEKVLRAQANRPAQFIRFANLKVFRAHISDFQSAQFIYEFSGKREKVIPSAAVTRWQSYLLQNPNRVRLATDFSASHRNYRFSFARRNRTYSTACNRTEKQKSFILCTHTVRAIGKFPYCVCVCVVGLRWMLVVMIALRLQSHCARCCVASGGVWQHFENCTKLSSPSRSSVARIAVRATRCSVDGAGESGNCMAEQNMENAVRNISF